MLAGFAERERSLFRWSGPYEPGDPMSDGAAIFPERWLDMDEDGRRDTWMRPVGPDAQRRGLRVDERYQDRRREIEGTFSRMTRRDDYTLVSLSFFTRWHAGVLLMNLYVLYGRLFGFGKDGRVSRSTIG